LKLLYFRYGKKAIFNNGAPSSSASPIRPRQRMMPQFNNNDNKMTPSPTPESSSVSTPLATTRSTLTSSSTTNKTNTYFQYQRSRRTSMFNRNNLPQEEEPSIRGPAPTSTVSTSAIVTSPLSMSPPRSPLLNKISEEHSTYRITRTPSPVSEPTTTAASEPTSATIEPKKTESTPRKRKVIKKPCKECGQHVSKKDYRGLKIHTGEILIFHTFCLFCAKCNQNFNGLEFCTDGKNFYHTEVKKTTRYFHNSNKLTFFFIVPHTTNY
jgi:hypothetical protein